MPTRFYVDSRSASVSSFRIHHQFIISHHSSHRASELNGTGREVEAHVARAPLLSLFRREEPVDGGDSEPYTLHSYLSTYTPSIATCSDRFPTDSCSVNWAHHPGYTSVYLVSAVFLPICVVIVCYSLILQENAEKSLELSLKLRQRMGE